MMRLVLVVVSVGLVIWLWGCGGGGGAPADTSPPTISNVQVNPQKLRFVGGEVTISAEVSDPSGVERVWAVVQPNGTQVVMELKDGVYKGTTKVGANTRNDGQEVTYEVWVWAEDKKGNKTSEPVKVSFTVSAPEPPPDAPKL